MTDAQTEARAIQRYIAPSAGRGAIVQLLKHCDGEWVRYRDHATALAAKDAELAVLRAELNDCASEIHELRAHLAEARKALANYDRWLNGRDAYIVQKGLWQNFVASLPGSPTARRVLEAHGGE